MGGAVDLGELESKGDRCELYEVPKWKLKDYIKNNSGWEVLGFSL